MLDKEKLELLNLRKKIVTQRAEINLLQARLERHREYTRDLERLCKEAIGDNENLEYTFQELIHTA